MDELSIGGNNSPIPPLPSRGDGHRTRLLTDTEASTVAATAMSRSSARSRATEDIYARLSESEPSPEVWIRDDGQRTFHKVDADSLEYIGEADDNLICSICHLPLSQPVELKCQHLFCGRCLRGALLHQQQDRHTCPACRKPLTAASIIPLPKVLLRILDNLTVKCPHAADGCEVILSRGDIETHLQRYCGYTDIGCPLEGCRESIPRHLFTTECLHKLISCPDCERVVAKFQLESHRTDSCEAAEFTCKDCSSTISKAVYEEHVSNCDETILKCKASDYGCDFVGKRATAQQHMANCTIAKLAPTIALQNTRLEEHAAALKALQQKNALHEAFLDTVEETLKSTEINMTGGSSDPTAPFDSPVSHLLSLHETLRQEVDRVSAAVSDLDAKTDTTFLNSSLRQKEEAAHRDAVITQLRIQVQWLVSSRLQAIHGTKSGTARIGTNNTSRETDAEQLGDQPPPFTAPVRRSSDGLTGRERL